MPAIRPTPSATATSAVGFGGGDGEKAGAQATDPDAGATLYAPAPVPTKTATGPAITLHASPTTAAERHEKKKPSSTSASPSKKASKSPATNAAADKPSSGKITLQAGTVSAKPMESISLTGIYPGGEGAILRLERREDGRWEEFGISDIRVTGEQFSTTVQTGRVGKHKVRMKDIDSGTYSNKVSVTIR